MNPRGAFALPMLWRGVWMLAMWGSESTDPRFSANFLRCTCACSTSSVLNRASCESDPYYYAAVDVHPDSISYSSTPPSGSYCAEYTRQRSGAESRRFEYVPNPMAILRKYIPEV